MLTLPTVTLVVIEHDFDCAVDLAQRMRSMIKFGAVCLSDHRNYEEFVAEEFVIHRRVHTPHLMTVHKDGYVTNPEMWNSAWLNYDLVGAPWPDGYLTGANPNWTYQVGNTGFCLRSKRLSEYVATLCHDLLAYDLTVCQQFRPGLEHMGFKFAPLELALQFSKEHVRPDTPEKTFGFHEPKTTKPTDELTKMPPMPTEELA